MKTKLRNSAQSVQVCLLILEKILVQVFITDGPLDQPFVPMKERADLAIVLLKDFKQYLIV